MGASNRSSTGYTHQDELAKTAQKQSKNLFYSHKRKQKIVAMFRSSSLRLFPGRRLLLFFQNPDTFWRLASLTARCITRQPHGSFLFCPHKEATLCVCEKV
jgi:hypothetical protein